MDYEIIKLNESTKELLNLYEQLYDYHHHNRPDKFIVNNLDARLSKDLESYTFIGIKKDNELIGFASYEIREKQRRILWIDQLVIDENHRKHGYCKVLLHSLELLAKELNCSAVEFCCWTFNHTALEVYRNSNYKEQRIIFEKNV